MNRASKQQGMSLIKVIALIPVVLIGLVVLAFIYTELNKAYWDYRVKQMCETDGGVEIFEHIDVTAEEFSKMPRVGSYIGIRDKKGALSLGDLVYTEYKSTDIHLPPLLIFNLSLHRVWRTKVLIKRLSDEKIIAREISYHRFGGDFPSLSNGSSFGCPPVHQMRLEREKIFIIKEK